MPKVKGKSKTRNHFEKVDDNTAKCKLCQKCLKIGGGTSNMLAHLNRAHPQTIAETSTAESSKNTNITQANMTLPEKIPKHGVIQQTLKLTQKTNEKKINQYLTLMIAKDFQPFSIVEDSGFKDFVNVLNPDYKLPTRQKIRYEFLPELYNKVKMELMVVLAKTEHVSITTDAWTSNTMESFLTVTVHFFHEGKLKSFVLSTATITSHTSDYLAKRMTEILDEWQIRQNVVAIVTDNAANMIKMCEILGKRNMPCFAHTLNLTLQNSLNLPELTNIIGKCKDTVRFYKKSSIAWDVLKKEQMERAPGEPPLKLLQEVPTRWNSQYYMLKRILQLTDLLAITSRKLTQAPPHINREEEDIIKEVVSLLDIFEEATKIVSGEQYATSSLVIPVICGLFENLTKIEQSLKTDIGKMFCSSLRRNMSNRLLAYENRTVNQIATYLHPVFTDGFRQLENMVSAKELVKKELSQLMKEIEPRGTETETSENSETEIAESSSAQVQITTKPKLLDFLKQRKLERNTNITASAINIIKMYRETECKEEKQCIGVFWQMNKHLEPLNKLAFKYLSVPATSVPSERVFSQTGYTVSSRRNALKAEVVDMLCFVNFNYSSSKLRRNGVLSLYPHPRVGRASHKTWDVPLDHQYADQFSEMEADQISKRQLYAFPRVGRSDSRLSNLALLLDSDQPPAFLRHGRDLEDDGDMEMPVRRTDNPGMWFGPRLGRGYKSEDDEIERNQLMDSELKENENIARKKRSKQPL